MTDAEWTVWEAANEQTRGWQRADSPCRDCTPLFHADMWEGGMCDGRPGGESPPHRGGRPSTLPAEFQGKTTAELRAIRADLRVALRRAQWREWREKAKRTVTA